MRTRASLKIGGKLRAGVCCSSGSSSSSFRNFGETLLVAPAIYLVVFTAFSEPGLVYLLFCFAGAFAVGDSSGDCLRSTGACFEGFSFAALAILNLNCVRYVLWRRSLSVRSTPGVCSLTT